MSDPIIETLGHEQNEKQTLDLQGHLPECDAHHVDGFIIGDCICDALRACEQRVRDAAREEVLNAPRYGCTESGESLMELREVIDAIDDLREEQR